MQGRLKKHFLAKMKNKRKSHREKREAKRNMVEVSFLSQRLDSMIASFFCWTSIHFIPVSFKSIIFASRRYNAGPPRILMAQINRLLSKQKKTEAVRRTSKVLKKFSFLKRPELPKRTPFCRTYSEILYKSVNL